MKTRLVTERSFGTIFVGRPSPWGNPYKKGRDGTRNQVVAKYEKWLQKPAQHALRDRMRTELRGKKLFCPCGHGGKKKCHGNVIVQVCESLEFLEKPVKTFKDLKLFVFDDDEDEGDREKVAAAKSRIERIMETTKRSSADHPGRQRWLRFRESRVCTDDRVWIFTDGSTSGWHAAKIVRPGKDVRSLARYIPMTSTRNVGAEVNGFLLGLKHAPEGSNVTVVSDYLNIGAWMVGAYKINGDEVAEKIERARKLIESSRLTVSFCHHGGHQKDHSHFTSFNNGVDELCSKQNSVDYTVPWSAAFEKMKYAKTVAVDEDSETD